MVKTADTAAGLFVLADGISCLHCGLARAVGRETIWCRVGELPPAVSLARSYSNGLRYYFGLFDSESGDFCPVR